MKKDDNVRRIINPERENSKRNIIIDNIEIFIEKKNRYIQVILLLVAVCLGVAYGLVPEELQSAVRYTLVINIFMELYILQTKDSIMQKKMNWLSVDINAQNGGLRFEDEIEIKEFFKNLKSDFFLSGIAPSRFIETFQTELERLFQNNNDITVHILISSLAAVPENCAEYYGSRTDEDVNLHKKDLLTKLYLVVNAITTNKIFRKAFEEKRLLLATSDFVFTTSCVAYDIFTKIPSYSNIKVTFYQQGEHQLGHLPSIMLDNVKYARDMYPYFQNNLNEQWEAANHIKDKSELEILSEEIFDSMQRCTRKLEN